MKKVDIILSLITGEAVGGLFVWLFKNSPFYFPFLNFVFLFGFPFLAVVGIWLAEIIGRKYLFVYQLAKFLLIGAFFAIVDLTILNFLMVWLGISKEEVIKYTLFVITSFTIATALKYLGNKYWAFEKREKEKIEREFSIFFLVTLGSGIIQTITATFFFKILSSYLNLSGIFAGNVAKIIGICLASIWNFLGYKFIVFKK